MIKKCRICQVNFEIVNKASHSRQFCYHCVPEGLDRGERTNAKRRAAKKHALNLLGGCCLKCGITEPYLIDFHHVESELKEGSFGRLIGDSKIEEYFKELEKAIPLCSNCHRTFHYLEGTAKMKIEDFVDLENFKFHKETVDREYKKVEKEIKISNKLKPEEAELILKQVKKSSFTEVAKTLNVTATAVQKRLKENGYPYLIKDIKGINSKPKLDKEPSWKELPLTLKKDEKVFSFLKGEDAAFFIKELNPEKDLARIREGISRVIRGQRDSYLKFKLN